MKDSYGKIIIGVGIILGCVFLVRYTGLSELLSVEAMRSTILGYGVYGPVIYVLFYILASLFFIPGTPLTLLGGAIFGPVYGTVYTVIGATVGALLAFWFARFFGQGLLHKQTGKIGQELNRYDGRLASHGFVTVVFLRLVPLFPFNGLNFALGLTRVRNKDYFLGTLLGIIPGTFAFVYFGDSLASLSFTKIAIAGAALVVLTVGGQHIMKRFDTK